MKVKGLNNVLRNLAKMDPKVWKKPAMKKMRDSQKGARSEMRSAAPKDSGKLKRSIRTQAWMKNKADEFNIFVRTGPILKGKGRMWYAHFPEVGTTGYTGFRYIADAKDAHEAAVRQDMINIIRDVVKQGNGKK